jgi:tetratricopeptide (TPR) repeat protein
LVAFALAAGVTFRQIGYWRDAETTMRRAADVVPNNYLAHSCLGEIYDSRGEPERAAAEYHEALRIKPDDPLALYNLAVQAWKAGQDSEAEALCARSIAGDPYYAPAYHNLAMSLAAKGRLDEAIDLWRKALEVDPDYAEARFRLDQALRYREQIRRAKPPL